MLQMIVEKLKASGFECVAGPLENHVAFVELEMLAAEADKLLSDDYDLYEEYRFIQNQLAVEGYAVSTALLERIEDARYAFLVEKGIVAPEG